MSRHRGTVLCCLVTSAAVAAAALTHGQPASGAVRQAQGPRLEALLIVAGDLGPRNKVDYENTRGTSAARAFSPPVALGSARFAYLVNSVDLYETSTRAAAEYEKFRAALTTAAFRKALIESAREGVREDVRKTGGSGLRLRRVVFGKVTPAGPSAVQLIATFAFNGGRVKLAVAGFLVDRTVGSVMLVGTIDGSITPNDVARTVALARGRMLSEFTVSSVASPLVYGTPAPGSILRADHGVWRGAPSTFTYAWQRCSGSGSCAPIAGATAWEYTVSADDVGSALRVEITATNTVSSMDAVSPSTALVS